MMKHIIVIIASFISFQGFTQGLWQKKIDDAQKVLCKKDSVNGQIVTISSNAEVNLVATRFVINKVDDWQKFVDNEKGITGNEKVRLLRSLLNHLNSYNGYAKTRGKNKEFSAGLAQDLFGNFNRVIAAQTGKMTLMEAIEPLGFLASRIIVDDEFAKPLKDYTEAKEAAIIKDCVANPDKILSILTLYPNIKAADSLIEIAAYHNQDKLYDYAQSKRSPLYNKIKNHKNGLVQTLFNMAQMETGRSLTPFLDAISRKEVSIDTINKLQNNPVAYYRLLVKTRIGYTKRLANGETILAINNFNAKIKEKALDFVKDINEAHTKPDVIRFAPLNPLNAQELYYMAVYGIDELFTSSFNRGVFQQMINKLSGITTSQLLQQVHSDYFRKFIKISAGYNKLSTFLKLMPDTSARVLMDNFISDLVKNDDITDIEDAVDVADAYVGIGANADLKNVSDQILQKVKAYQSQYKGEGNNKGETVYRLFDLIFKSYKDTTVNLSAQLGIPSITKVDYAALAKEKAQTVVKLYFYGDEDKDGQISYLSFMNLFGDKTKWKIESNAWFTNIKSIKGKPIQIFANKALYDVTKKTDPDDTAKVKMNAYMLTQNLKPTFVMHRGHSYHVPITLRYMEEFDTTAKLIVLGSCGGYQNLQKVLEICPDAHIVSSKQTGTFTVNDPMMRLLLTDINDGKSITWPEIWPRIKISVGGGAPGEMFTEYIPPHQNLGMIFIKAYKKQMQL
jgi:hypothetical protein